MPTERKKPDQWMPPKVYKGKYSYYWKPDRNRSITLCKADASKATVWAAYEAKAKELDGNHNSVAKWVEAFFQSGDFAELSITSQKDYRKCSLKVLAAFGKVDVRKVKPMHIRAYMDKRGAAARTRANRELSFMQKLFGWLYERGKVEVNPSRGIKRYKESARTRYIEDDEYQLLLDNLPPALVVAMELSYLLGARQGDVLTMRWDQIKQDGISIMQSKTGKRQIKTYTPRLREVLAKARLLAPSNTTSVYVVCQSSGGKYSSDGFRTVWSRSIKALRETTGLLLDFTFHDIKAKGITDYEGDKQKFSGHKTRAQVEVYNRKGDVVASLGGEKPSK